MSTVSTESATSVTPEQPQRYYRFSALLYGFLRMWRGFVPMAVTVIVNAILQGVLLLGYGPTTSSYFWVVLAVLSAVAFMITCGVLVAAALDATEGRARFGEAFARVRANLGRFIAWALFYFVVVTIGLLFYTVPGFIFAAIFVFVPIAALDGKGNALGTNFRVIGLRFVRWLVTVILIGIIAIVLHFLFVFNGFFIDSFAGWALQWLAWGFIFSWLVTACALIYKSALAGRQIKPAPEPAVAPAQ